MRSKGEKVIDIILGREGWIDRDLKGGGDLCPWFIAIEEFLLPFGELKSVLNPPQTKPSLNDCVRTKFVDVYHALLDSSLNVCLNVFYKKQITSLLSLIKQTVLSVE